MKLTVMLITTVYYMTWNMAKSAGQAANNNTWW